MDVKDNDWITIPEGIPDVKVEQSHFYDSTKDKILDILRETFADNYTDTENIIELSSYTFPSDSYKDEHLYIICVLYNAFGFLIDTPLSHSEQLVDYWTKLMDKSYIELENREKGLEKLWRYILEGLYISYTIEYDSN